MTTQMPELYCDTLVQTIAQGATQNITFSLRAPGTVAAVAIAARDSSAAEINRRVIHLAVESGGAMWPRLGKFANAELVCGTGQNASAQAYARLLESEGTSNQVTIKIKNLGSTSIAETDVSIWVLEH